MPAGPAGRVVLKNSLVANAWLCFAEVYNGLSCIGPWSSLDGGVQIYKPSYGFSSIVCIEELFAELVQALP
ncbi:hypothetical protein Nepgr_018811 [Nepenthes gracilis]|uniref:Uncharacterized protein n=1 Tax=Nepenthes gracilis TaxID=150966 RepID=A0AAD3SS62_NEPGR|nr:hypothetical protein Nepgr_018811 [Nepenthes gracilis]